MEVGRQHVADIEGIEDKAGTEFFSNDTQPITLVASAEEDVSSDPLDDGNNLGTERGKQLDQESTVESSSENSGHSSADYDFWGCKQLLGIESSESSDYSETSSSDDDVGVDFGTRFAILCGAGELYLIGQLLAIARESESIPDMDGLLRKGLLAAILNDRAEVVSMLSDEIKKNTKGGLEDLSLVCAARGDDITLRSILEMVPGSPEFLDRLYLAAVEKGHLNVVKLLLESGLVLENMAFLKTISSHLRSGYHTGICYDVRMEAHYSVQGHPERPARTQAAWIWLHECGILCHICRVESYVADTEDICLVHSSEYVQDIIMLEDLLVQKAQQHQDYHHQEKQEQELPEHREEEEQGQHHHHQEHQEQQEQPKKLHDGEQEEHHPDQRKSLETAETGTVDTSSSMGKPGGAMESLPGAENSPTLTTDMEDIEDPPLLRAHSPVVDLPPGEVNLRADTYARTGTALAARIAVGCCLSLVREIAEGRLKNGVSLIRPPGHHSEREYAMGFCIFNNIAITARYLLKNYPDKIRRILIFDWDVHHGNGTQHVFEDDRRVLFCSIHRHDHGFFYPGTGKLNELGIGEAKGFTVNIPWPHAMMGDAEYLAAMYLIVMPIATSFQPDIVLVSAGFDCAAGDPMGGMMVSPAGFAQMTHLLCSLASGRILLVLEGGYNVSCLNSGLEACMSVLCGPPHCKSSVNMDIDTSLHPCSSALSTLAAVGWIQSHFWPCMRIYRNWNDGEHMTKTLEPGDVTKDGMKEEGENADLSAKKEEESMAVLPEEEDRGEIYLPKRQRLEEEDENYENAKSLPLQGDGGGNIADYDEAREAAPTSPSLNQEEGKINTDKASTAILMQQYT